MNELRRGLGGGHDVVDGDIQVLYVDHDATVSETVAEFLEREDDRLTVVTETSTAKGIERLEAESIDCVVSDYDMPGEDGLAFLRTVREEDPTLPFVMFTGKGSEETASEAITAGVTDYFQKGTGADQYAVLANRIRNAVAQYRAQQRLERRVRQQEVVARLGRMALEGESLSNFFDETVGALTEALGTDLTAILEHRAEREEFLIRSATGVPDSWIDRRRQTDDPTTQPGHVFEVTGPLVVEDLSSEGRFTPGEPLVELGIQSGVEVTIGDRTDPWGVLGVHSKAARDFDGDDVTFVQSVANLLATAIERSEHERRLSTLISNLPGMVYRCDNAPAWPMEFVGGQVEELTGYTAEELESDAVSWGEDILVEEDQDWLWAEIQAALAANEPFEVTYRIETRDGDRKWAWEQGRGVYSADGELDALEGFITDITDQREYERRLERERDRLDDFARIVSHDLRSPLEAAIGHTELLAAEEGEGEHVRGLRTQLGRMQELIEDVLTLVRQDPNVSEMEPVALEDVVRAAWETVATEDATLAVEDPGTVLADRSRLQQLLENLFLNSVEHGSTGSRTASPSDDSVEHGTPEGIVENGGEETVAVRVGRIQGEAGPRGFYVADDGQGIPEEDHDAVFDSGYSTTDEGTGFGLNIVERIATAHGWDVAATTSADGGARFEVTGVDFE